MGLDDTMTCRAVFRKLSGVTTAIDVRARIRSNPHLHKICISVLKLDLYHDLFLRIMESLFRVNRHEELIGIKSRLLFELLMMKDFN